MNLAIGLIDCYQRYISPYKGFSCAYRVSTGHSSCSAFARECIADKGFFGAWPDIRERLKSCGQHARQLTMSVRHSDNNKKRDGKYSFCDPSAGCYTPISCESSSTGCGGISACGCGL